VPDHLDNDDDNDGIPDHLDTDDDGDGEHPDSSWRVPLATGMLVWHDRTAPVADGVGFVHEPLSIRV
jgi:hypothetical protein